MQGSFGDAETALPAIAEEKIEVVLLDDALPGVAGCACIRRIREAAPEARILVISAVPGDDVVFDRVEAGADGFLVKDSLAMATLLNEIRLVHAGQHPLPDRAWNLAREALREYRFDPAKPEILTKREHEVARLMRKGKTNKQIAESLGVTIRTIDAHVRNIFTKTDSRNRQEAIFKLWRNHAGGRDILRRKVRKIGNSTDRHGPLERSKNVSLISLIAAGREMPASFRSRRSSDEFPLLLAALPFGQGPERRVREGNRVRLSPQSSD